MNELNCNFVGKRLGVSTWSMISYWLAKAKSLEEVSQPADGAD